MLKCNINSMYTVVIFYDDGDIYEHENAKNMVINSRLLLFDSGNIRHIVNLDKVHVRTIEEVENDNAK